MTKTPDNQEISQDELLKKYDKESTYRTNLGTWAILVTVIGIALTIFHLWTANNPYRSVIQGAIHLAGGMSLIFLLYPAKKSMTNKKGIAWYDIVLAFIALFANFYIVVNYDDLFRSSVVLGYEWFDKAVAAVFIALLLEGTRRAVGLPIVIIALVAVAYGLWGSGIPYFGHAGFSFDRLMTDLVYSSEAIFGTPIQISSTYIYLFLFFGVMLVKTNIGQFFNDLAFGATGRFTGGTAKAAVFASGMQGMVTGSSVANTVSSGSFTIPMMKRAGFKPEFAAATEASASTGGQIMPPIMGAAAFIMIETIGVPYNEIILVALIPALLYFTGVFIGTHFEARKLKIYGLPKEELPSFTHLLKKMDLLLPLIAILFMLYSGFTPTTAALWGIFAAFAISFIRSETRLSIKDMLYTLEQGARIALPVIAACATAGIIVGIVVFTGLGGKIANGIIDIAGGNFFLVMFFTMIACIILGMGLPTTANYVVTASLAAPALIEFGVPEIAAHFFVFYFGIVADITPPVCLAAYAGAGIARANPMKAGVTSVKLAIAAFVIPYIFVTNPVLVLQDATVQTLIPALITAFIGMVGISAGMINYFVVQNNILERLLLIAGGIMLLLPELYISLPGLGLIVLVYIMQRFRKHRQD
ncbi:TRAP transporter, 4TM/12TM fusion protein [Alteribacillus persepolensis]|uniref:TRAP transporter, 4TM/12TM fusion protein n=1 Tax=Alteribacillus persepolensis TaxID=568899 RepID=A0A1G8H515_9BACI|nr:TRAP transporter permease [Alteribacillus persepolensis]SDI01649.1 TRAP transporter, 4TM/12TM fusion protein [Alteribacillus persepolensis]